MSPAIAETALFRGSGFVGRRGSTTGDGGPGGPASATANSPSDSTNSAFATGGAGGNGGNNGGAGGAASASATTSRPTPRETPRASRTRQAARGRWRPFTPPASAAMAARRHRPPSRPVRRLGDRLRHSTATGGAGGHTFRRGSYDRGKWRRGDRLSVVIGGSGPVNVSASAIGGNSSISGGAGGSAQLSNGGTGPAVFGQSSGGPVVVQGSATGGNAENQDDLPAT